MFKIAIDGPAGAGKSTIAMMVAQKLNIEYIDTGAMYRAVTLKGLSLNLDLLQEESYVFLNDTTLDIVSGKVLMDGIDVSKAIRSIEVTKNAWMPSKMGIVRHRLVDLQRQIAAKKSCVMDGRDIGTVVLPDADLKIYLTADLDERTRRRMEERKEAGIIVDFETTKKEIDDRDYSDMHREIGPLKQANDAVLVDSTGMNKSDVVDLILRLINERGLIKMSEKEFKEGMEVTGTIINVKKEAIYVEFEDGAFNGALFTNDMKDFTEGKKLSESYHEGEPLTALVKQVAIDKKDENKKFIILSTKLYEIREIMPKFEELKQSEEIIDAKVVTAFKAGCELEYLGVKLFMPARFAVLSVNALNELKGETIKVVVTDVDQSTLRVIVSQIIAERKIARAKREAAMEKLHVDDVVTGKVTEIFDFGAIVDLGDVSGLLHQSQIDFKRFAKVADYMQIGDEVTVKIIGIEGDKIALSIRALKTHPWDKLKEQFHVGDVFEGSVEKIIPAGLIIKLTDDYSGLMPNGEYSWFVNDRVNGKVVEGDTIKVKVMSIDDEKKRVSLSRRETLENTWKDIKLKKDQQIEVEVASFNEFGAIVHYQNVEGFLSLREIASDKRITSASEVYQVGDKIKVMVMECDPSRARLTVSSRRLAAANERATFDNYKSKETEENKSLTIGDLLGDKITEIMKGSK